MRTKVWTYSPWLNIYLVYWKLPSGQWCPGLAWNSLWGQWEGTKLWGVRGSYYMRPEDWLWVRFWPKRWIGVGEVGQRCYMHWIRTSNHVPDDGISTVASIVDGLNAVGVLGTRYQARNINSSRLRGLLFGIFSWLAGLHRQLGRRTQTSTFKIHKSQPPSITTQDQ